MLMCGTCFGSGLTLAGMCARCEGHGAFERAPILRSLYGTIERPVRPDPPPLRMPGPGRKRLG